MGVKNIKLKLCRRQTYFEQCAYTVNKNNMVVDSGCNEDISFSSHYSLHTNRTEASTDIL